MVKNYHELYLSKSNANFGDMEQNPRLEQLRKKLKATVSTRIADTRNDLRKSQPDLLAELEKYGLIRTQGSVSQIENGKRLPSLEMIYVIAQFLDTSTDYLLGFTINELSSADIEEELAAVKDEGKINKAVRRLTKQKQQQVLTFAEYLLSREGKTKSEAPKISPLPPTERQRNLAMIKARLDSVEREYGTDARRDMERSIREELSNSDAGE